MALTICRECKNEISSKADSCPRCGYKKSSSGCSTGCLGIMILFILVIIVPIHCGRSRPRSSYSSSRRAPVNIGNKRILNGDYFGCTTREYLEKLMQYARHGDKVAFENAHLAGQLAGVVTSFKDGESVYIVDITTFSGLVKVRREGEVQEYWTVTEAVK